MGHSCDTTRQNLIQVHVSVICGSVRSRLCQAPVVGATVKDPVTHSASELICTTIHEFDGHADSRTVRRYTGRHFQSASPTRLPLRAVS